MVLIFRETLSEGSSFRMEQQIRMGRRLHRCITGIRESPPSVYALLGRIYPLQLRNICVFISSIPLLAYLPADSCPLNTDSWAATSSASKPVTTPSLHPTTARTRTTLLGARTTCPPPRRMGSSRRVMVTCRML